MNLVKPHGMTKNEAKEWVDKQLPELLDQFGSSVQGVKHHWEGDTLHFSFALKLAGQINGVLGVNDTQYALDVPLNFRQRLFEGKARAAMVRWLDENLG